MTTAKPPARYGAMALTSVAGAYMRGWLFELPAAKIAQQVGHSISP
jgi:hypothetical protein